MCEDLSLRVRPRRHEIDHEMAIRRAREATSPRDGGTHGAWYTAQQEDEVSSCAIIVSQTFRLWFL